MRIHAGTFHEVGQQLDYLTTIQETSSSVRQRETGRLRVRSVPFALLLAQAGIHSLRWPHLQHDFLQFAGPNIAVNH